MINHLRISAILWGLLALGAMPAALAQDQGLPASNQLGHEDIWHNPGFRGGAVNGGTTAHSEW